MKVGKSLKITETAIKAASGSYGASEYRGGSNSYRGNVGEWWNGKWHSDCLGFVHIMVNGFYGDKNKLGGGAIMDDFVNNSTEYVTLTKYCSIRGKFPVNRLKKCSLLEMHDVAGHVGMYTGESGLYNTAECSSGGWQRSWTDLQTGICYNQKGGFYRHRWENWGEFDRVDYSDQEAKTVKLNGARNMRRLAEMNVPNDYNTDYKVASFTLPRGRYQLTVTCIFDADKTGTRYIGLNADGKSMGEGYQENKQASPQGNTRLTLTRPIDIDHKTVFDVYASHSASESLNVTTYAGYYK